jgi:hypothetical protein
MKRWDGGPLVLTVERGDAEAFAMAAARLRSEAEVMDRMAELCRIPEGWKTGEEHEGTRTDTDGHGRARTEEHQDAKRAKQKKEWWARIHQKATPACATDARTHGHTATPPAGAEKRCEACGAAFVPNWKRKDQKFCKEPECIRERARKKAMALYRAKTGSTGAHPVTACRNCGAPRASTPWPKRGALCKACDHKRAMGRIPKVGQGNRAARMAPVAPRPPAGAGPLKPTWKDRIREAAEKASAEIEARRGRSESED